MSLEATIQENTNAIRELIAAIKAGVPTTAAQVAAVVTEAKDEAAAGKKSKATTAAKADAAATPPTAEATAAPEPKAENSAAAAGSAPSYQDAATAVTKLSRTKGRDAAVALLAKFGATKLPDVKPEQFAEVITAANEAMGS